MTDFSPAEVAAETGFSLDTLRYYEKEGLIGPVRRSPGGRRVYTEADLDRLDLVRCLRDTGMPIADLREYARLAADDSSLRERIELLAAHDARVQADIDALRRRQDQLREKIGWYRTMLGLEASSPERRPRS